MGRGIERGLRSRWALVAGTFAVLAAIASGCGSSDDSSTTTPTSTPTTASASASRLAPVHGTYAPKIDPTNFVTAIDNPYFPLKPSTGFHYQGVAENGSTPQTDDMVVTHQTKQILGVAATVVRDTVSSHGRPIEKTFDWYAQDKGGNVWYMGEDTRELDHGRFVKQSDSWEAGVDGAEPGIIMPGDPQPGDAYRQEYYPGYALDQARVLGSGGPVSVPYGSYKDTLATVETSPKIDPGVRERKYYVRGVGDIKEHTVSGNHEQIKLISITHQ
ncbi:MAG TPA: hypothetical protein VN458_12480 [Solirubrobacterales bacterium]|nr:hypothetical protein [Solirubrobacterales bacterium]